MINIWLIILGILMTCFNWIDYLLTRKLLKGGGRELNPILRKMDMFWVKLVINVAIIVVAILTYWAVLILPTALFLFACVWNWMQYKTVMGLK